MIYFRSGYDLSSRFVSASGLDRKLLRIIRNLRASRENPTHNLFGFPVRYASYATSTHWRLSIAIAEKIMCVDYSSSLGRSGMIYSRSGSDLSSRSVFASGLNRYGNYEAKKTYHILQHEVSRKVRYRYFATSTKTCQNYSI
jgi:hypothetical protein